VTDRIPGEEIVAQLGGERVALTQAPVLHRVLEALCQRAGLPRPTLFVIPDPEINAFTTGSAPERALVAVNAGLLRHATESELESVLAHELGHVVHGDVQAKTRIALGCLGARVAGRVAGHAIASTIDDDDDLVSGGLKLLAGLAVSLGSDVATSVYTTQRNHEHEFRADAYAAELTGKPWALASLFAKLERAPGSGEMPAELAQLFFTPPRAAFTVSTHPPIAERIRRMTALPSSSPSAPEAGGFCPGCGGRLRRGRCASCPRSRPRSTVCGCCGARGAAERAFCTTCGAARDV